MAAITAGTVHKIVSKGLLRFRRESRSTAKLTSGLWVLERIYDTVTPGAAAAVDAH